MNIRPRHNNIHGLNHRTSRAGFLTATSSYMVWWKAESWSSIVVSWALTPSSRRGLVRRLPLCVAGYIKSLSIEIFVFNDFDYPDLPLAQSQQK